MLFTHKYWFPLLNVGDPLCQKLWNCCGRTIRQLLLLREKAKSPVRRCGFSEVAVDQETKETTRKPKFFQFHVPGNDKKTVGICENVEKKRLSFCVAEQRTKKKNDRWYLTLLTWARLRNHRKRRWGWQRNLYYWKFLHSIVYESTLQLPTVV
jgi:hypothetical protein